MMIDHVLPHVVAGKGTLREHLLRLARDQGLSAEEATERFILVPAPLVEAGTFLDRVTNLWRYEFGTPFEIGGSLVWGAHMWVPVDHLHRAVTTANARLPEDKRAAYYNRLNDQERHAVTLAEMIPGSKLADEVHTEFEVSGYGAGNSTLDWVIHVPGRAVLLDVKSRTKDFIEQMTREDGSQQMPDPEHDPALLFRSLENKFLPANPDASLQGIWIATHIQQNVNELNQAFAALDSEKVHFAVLGDWGVDVHLLVKREADRQYLLDLFKATPSDRFAFMPQAGS